MDAPVSLILPTRNAEWCLPYCLRSVKNLEPQPSEILICVGKSGDGTENIVAQFQRDSATPVRVFHDREGLGTGYAMSVMVPEASSDLCVWVGSDHVLPGNFIAFVRTLFKIHEVSWLQGIITEISPKDIGDAVALKIDVKRAPFTRLEGRWSPTGSLEAFNRSDVLRVGGFDPSFARGQDTDLLMRLVGNGLAGGVSCGTVHAGVTGAVNFRKVLVNRTFWKLFRKYGWRYCLVDRHHFLGASLRMAFILSLVGLLFSPLFLAPLTLSFVGLVAGIVVSYRRFTVNLLLLQVVGSVGELIQLVKVILT